MVFEEYELKLESAIESALFLVDKNDGPIVGFYKNQRYHDEPLLYQYTSVIKKTAGLSDFGDNTNELAGGTSIIKERAIMKALGEAIERYCLAIYKEKNFVFASKDELGEEALDVKTLEGSKPIELDNKTKIRWIEGYSLTKGKKILIPAQLVFVPYKYHKEPVIRLPISTGAACGTALGAAIKRGIFEIIERDSFMIFYLNKLTPKRIDIGSSQKSEFIIIRDMFLRYNLELHLFDITTNLKTTSVMAIIVDRTSIGPAVSVGLKASDDIQSAVIGAIEEAQQIRAWMRSEMSRPKKKNKNSARRLDVVDRGLYWSKVDVIDKLNFLLESKKFLAVDKFIKNNVDRPKLDLQNIVKIFKQLSMEVVYVNLTEPEIVKQGFNTVKVIIPQLHPLFLYENFKYLWGNRLYNIPVDLGYKRRPTTEKQLNSIPHPFL